MDNKEVGIKELNEILDGLEAVLSVGGKVMKDGKVGFDDLAHLPELALKFEVLKQAVDNAKGAVDELKDLEEAEVLALIGRIYGLVKAFEEAKK